jgi:phosphate transport system substrate-binding protein
MILPTDSSNGFTATKGFTLGEFGKYLLCQGQAQVDALGYSALPINLVQAGYQQLAKVQGANIPANLADQIRTCNNPTFSTDGTNTLANTDPVPPDCDRRGPTQCTTGTGGAKASTPVSGGNGPGGGQAPGASGTAAPGASSGASAGPADTCDPSSGLCQAAGGGGIQNAAVAVPVNTPPIILDVTAIVLMAVAAALLIVLVVAPPLLAWASAHHRARLEQAEE